MNDKELGEAGAYLRSQVILYLLNCQINVPE